MTRITRRWLPLACSWLILASCGGGGGGGTAPAPATGVSLSGSISIAPTAAVDSDSNDVIQLAQGGYKANNDPGNAQTIVSPVLLVGTVNKPGTGPVGNNRTLGDSEDWFKVDLVAGQVVELEFAADPAQSDVDLHVISTDTLHTGTSDGVNTRFECVRVTVSTSYFIVVNAFSNASIYNLHIGAPGSAGNCAVSANSARAVPDQLLAKARRIDAAQAPLVAARLKSAGVSGANLATDSVATPVPHLLHLASGAAERAAGLLALSATGAGKTAALPALGAQAQNALPDPLLQRIELLKYAKRLQATGAFEYVQPNWIDERTALVGTFPPNDLKYPLQRWHYEQINLPSAMSRITALSSQPAQRPLVAVIDDGVVLNHPDFIGQLFSNGRAFISTTTAGDGNLASGDNTATRADQPVFHGTHVAGTVGAATFDGVGGAGTAPMALILPLRVFPPKGGAAQVDTINAMLYAARLANNSGTLPARRADVINMSLGSDRACDSAYLDAIAQVRAAGVIVVVAAGNSGHNPTSRAAVGTPANCSGAIAVSALDARKGITPYSNTGAQIAVAAPGGDSGQSTTGTGVPDEVYSDLAAFDANGVRQAAFGGMQGTSMAAPHVAGVMALMRYVNPNLTVNQVDTLLAAGSLTDDLGAAGRDIDFGFGLINARKAVDAALQAAGNPTLPPAGQVVATPSSIDFGSFQTSAALDLEANATNNTETVVSVVSDNAAVTVTPGTPFNATTGLGRRTVNVNRAALAPGSIFPKLTVTLAPARTLTVQLSVTQPAGGATTSTADYGPIYVLLVNPDTQAVVTTVVAQRAGGQYTWSSSGYTLPRVSIIAGGDLDNDDVVCQRGEPCGAFPVLAPGGDLSVIELSGNRSDLGFQVAPLSGMSALSTGAAGGSGWRRQRSPPPATMGGATRGLQ
ncbi:MAG: S8 family serine peptidase [Burkholderiaceae bacterium]